MALRGFGELPEPEERGVAGAGVATVRVAKASPFTLAPQSEQKRLVSEMSVPQEAHFVT